LEKQCQWATPNSCDYKGATSLDACKKWEHRGQNLPEMVLAKWATPNAFCFQPPENTEQWTKRAEYQQTEKGVNLHKPIQTQVLHELEKQWATPQTQDAHNVEQKTKTHKTIPAQLTKMNSPGKLNPRWVETLQGLPMGYTESECPPSVIKNWTKFIFG
jgi:hypothetical protein